MKSHVRQTSLIIKRPEFLKDDHMITINLLIITSANKMYYANSIRAQSTLPIMNDQNCAKEGYN